MFYWVGERIGSKWCFTIIDRGMDGGVNDALIGKGMDRAVMKSLMGRKIDGRVNEWFNE